ncbi:MAG: TonB family protein [Acidobacteriota bacterium]
MGKIVKYCSSCDEGFAERFGFCPDCGAQLQAFEMNPLEAANSVTDSSDDVSSFETIQAGPGSIESEFIEQPEVLSTAAADEIEISEPEVEGAVIEAQPAETAADLSPAIDLDEESEPVEIEEEPTSVTAPAFVFQTPPMYADGPSVNAYVPDEGFHVTMVQEKNGKQRNLLLLGASALMLTLTLGAWGVSLFSKDLGVGAIGDERSLALLIEEVPMPVEDEPEKKKDDKGGGGGGGGREEKTEVNQGDLADQSRTPTRPPDSKVFRSDFELKTPPPQTEGDKKFEKKYNVWGDPNALSTLASNGTGTGGGMGSGNGRGQGSGNGTGTGSGSGSGYGGGNGNGNGNGTGDGNDGGPPPPSVPKVTSELKILSKQKPSYTDAARQNNVQGTVTLRVTFLGSGQIGSISTISGLPHGLTEQAIAAARNIRFEPKKVNGVPVAVSRPVTFSFSIY